MKNLFYNAKSLEETTEIRYEKDGVWTVKKLLAIEWFIKPFHKIASKYFKTWNYVDFFSGSGMVGLSVKGFTSKHPCTGSALVPLFLANEFSFTDYYFFDINENNVRTLNNRIDKLRPNLPSNITLHKSEAIPFEQASSKLFGLNGLIPKTSSISLVIIDPEDLAVTWNLLEPILTTNRIDMILTIMTYALALNHSNALREPAKYAALITKFFGDDTWRHILDGEGLIEYYSNKIRNLGYKVQRVKVHRIGQSKIYDLLLITKNDTVAKIFGDLSRKMDQVTPKLLADAVAANEEEHRDLDNWIFPGKR